MRYIGAFVIVMILTSCQHSIIVIPAAESFKDYNVRDTAQYVCYRNAFPTHLPFIKDHSESEIVEFFERGKISYSQFNPPVSYSMHKSNDTLIVLWQSLSTIRYSFTFHLDDGNCDYELIEYRQPYTFLDTSCTCNCSCLSNFFERIVSIAPARFVKVSANKYMSDYTWQTECELIKSDDLQGKIVFRYIDMPYKEYKKEYKALKHKKEM